MPSTRLKALKIDEVSGVDSGAHMLDGWVVCKARDGTIPLLTKALAGFDPDALIADLAKANPNQHRGDDGRYRSHISGLTDRTEPPAAVEAPSSIPAADDLSADTAKGLQFFRPVTDAYRRLW